MLDATFSSLRRREALRDVLRAPGVPWAFVELEAAPGTLRARLKARETAADIVSDARLEDFEALNARYQAPDALEDACHVIACADTDVEATTQAILEHLIQLELRRPIARPKGATSGRARCFRCIWSCRR